MKPKLTIEALNNILAHFELTPQQKQQFEQMGDIYRFWNEQINVVSRKDIGEIYTRHILHSLAIAKFSSFAKGTSIVDIGCGGGFPGIPLAVMFPDCHFTMVDSIGKKIKVVNEVAQALHLSNVEAIHARSEQLKSKHHFVVSRAVTAFPEFVQQTRHLISNKHISELRNGIIYLKGGDFSEEVKPFVKNLELHEISAWFEDPFFETKKIIYLPIQAK